MIQDVELRLSERQIVRGQDVQGLISFSSPSPRNLTDFLIQVTLEASLHTVVPSSSGVHSHADRTAFRDTKTLKNLRVIQGRHFEIPFTYSVPATCPISMTYKKMAKIQWKLKTSIKDLSVGHTAAATSSTNIEILPSQENTKSSPTTATHRKVTYTANTVIVPATSYFLQLAYPARYDIVDHRITLTSSLKISNGSPSFAKRTERPLSIFRVISRKAPDESNLTVLEVCMPAGLECSVDVVGLVRKYSLSVYLAPKNKTALNLSFDVTCDHIPLAALSRASPSISTLPRTAPTTPAGKVVRTEVGAPEPFSRSTLTAQSLKRLSMGQLASKALTLDKSSALTIEHQSTSMVTRSSSTSSQTSSSDYESASSGSPRSVASSISDSSSKDRMTSQFSSPPTSPRTPSSQNKPAAAVSKHKRQTSSFSAMSKRTSDLLSFSNISRRLKPSKSFEFSCRGPSELPPPSALTCSRKEESPQQEPYTFPPIPAQSKQSEPCKRPITPVEQMLDVDDMPDTPGSCYSSMPTTPTVEADPFDSLPSSPTRSATLARRLSFSRAQTKRGSSPHFPMPDKRFSISTCYLDGFNFEGLSSLDDEPTVDDQDSIYSSELAAGQAL